MRFGVVVGLALVLGACGQAEPAKPVEPVAAGPVELGETKSAIDCPLERATYSEPQAGWELRFRPGQPWEMMSMTTAVFDLVGPDGDTVWGEATSNMGTSRDVGRLFNKSCERPGPDGPDYTEQEWAACTIWENVIYSLNGGEPGYLAAADSNAPERLLLSDLGRKMRYQGPVEGPGDEPWDVFTFKSCAAAATPTQ